MSVKEGFETEGVSIPTFSGHAEDFAKFKREFEAVVVPNRYPLHVAAYLRAAVPTELESQLFDSLPFPDHIAMMQALMDEFAYKASSNVIFKVRAKMQRAQALINQTNALKC